MLYLLMLLVPLVIYGVAKYQPTPQAGIKAYIRSLTRQSKLLFRLNLLILPFVSVWFFYIMLEFLTNLDEVHWTDYPWKAFDRTLALGWGWAVFYVLNITFSILVFVVYAGWIKASINEKPPTKPLPPELLEELRRISKAADLPSVPSLYLISMLMPLGASLALEPRGGHLLLSEMLIEKLGSRRCAGILAHEIAHIKHGDAIGGSMMRVSRFFTSLLLVWVAWHATGTSGSTIVVALMLTFGVRMFLAAWICSVYSIKWEYAADALGVLLMESPQPLYEALSIISGEGRMEDLPQRIRIMLQSATRFPRHPPTSRRLDMLKQMKSI